MTKPRAIRAVLVDDEAPARTRLRHLLRREPDIELIAECAGGREAIEVIQRERPDLVFLDIQMPRVDGFEVCCTLGPAGLPLVIFVTAYDQFALRAFEVHAVDYLLKPVDADRLRQTLEHVRARRRPSAPANDDRLSALLAELRPAARSPERLAFRVDGRVVLVRVQEIEWVEADGNYVHLHMGPRSLMVRETLAALEAGLPADRFLRISRSTVVNLDAVAEMEPLFHGDYTVKLRGGQQLTLSRTHRDQVGRLLDRRGPAGPA